MVRLARLTEAAHCRHVPRWRVLGTAVALLMLGLAASVALARPAPEDTAGQ